MAKNGFRVLDSDLHVMEPGDLYERFLDRPFKHRAPRREWSAVAGVDKWVVEGHVMPLWADWPEYTAANAKLIAKKAQTPEQVRAHQRGFDAPSTLDAMDIEGIDIAVLYRTVAGIMSQGIDDLEPAFAAALCRAYNRWIAGYCAIDPARLKGAAVIPLHDVDLAIAEARYASRTLGLAAACFYPEPVNGRHLYDTDTEPLWAELAALGMPAAIHGTTTAPGREDFARKYLKHPAGRTFTQLLSFPTQMMTAMSGLILSGVLERHPALRVAFLEANCSWLPWLLYRMDHVQANYPDAPLSHPPSRYFLRQCFISMDCDEALAADVIARLGDDCLVISTDYPHSDSAFPHAMDEFFEVQLPDASRKKILWDNCARFYGFGD